MKPNEVSQNKAEVTDGFLAPIQNSCYVMEYLLGMPGNKMQTSYIIQMLKRMHTETRKRN